MHDELYRSCAHRVEVSKDACGEPLCSQDALAHVARVSKHVQNTMPQLCFCKNICHQTAVDEDRAMVPKERVESPLIPCAAGRQGRQPQLDCGSGNSRTRFAWSGPLDCRGARTCHPVFVGGIVPGRSVAGVVTLLDGVAIAVASGYCFSSQGLKE